MNLEDQHQELFTIHQISLRADIPKSTLRYWEKELQGYLIPLRTDGGQRRYSFEHLSKIELIKELRAKGASLVEIKKTLSENIQDENAKEVDVLANRVAEAVKMEVYRFYGRLVPRNSRDKEIN
jgi:DNA-binding transcriptional MerR regulator